MNLTDFFERIYIVNLPERDDRRREMQQELARIDLRIDGDRVRYFRAVRPDNAGLFPSLGARGCFMSHFAICEEAIRDGLNNVLVMEDDLAFDMRLPDALPMLLQRLRIEPWDIAYFGHFDPATHAVDVDAPIWRSTTAALATTHFYALNRRALTLLRNHLKACLEREPGHPLGSPMHVDGAFSLLRSLDQSLVTLIATPSLGGQRSSRSDIFPNRWYDRLPLTQPCASLARKAKNRLIKALPGLQSEHWT